MTDTEELGMRMREAQKAYFRGRRYEKDVVKLHDLLKAATDLECDFDWALIRSRSEEGNDSERKTS